MQKMRPVEMDYYWMSRYRERLLALEGGGRSGERLNTKRSWQRGGSVSLAMLEQQHRL